MNVGERPALPGKEKKPMRKRVTATVLVRKKVGFVFTVPDGADAGEAARKKVLQKLCVHPTLDEYKIKQIDVEDFEE